MINIEATVGRRRFLAGCGAAALAGAAGCSGPQQQSAGTAVDDAALPAYLPFAGARPDLPGEVDRCSPAFFDYPASPQPFAPETPGDGQRVTAMVPTSFTVPPALAQNAYWQELNRRLGCELDIGITTSADYDAKFATTVAGGDLPDLFSVGTIQSLPEFMHKSVADLTEHLGGDKIKNYPGLANIPTDSWKQVVFDGKILGLPIQRGLMNLPVLFARDDLLRAAGLTDNPKNFEEFHTLCRELTDADRSRWALTDAPLNFLRSMVDLPNVFAVSGAGFSCTYTDERQQTALEAARKLRDEGLIHPDGAATGTPVQKNWLGAGTCVLLEDSFIAWFSLYTQHARVAGFELRALPVPGYDGGQGTQLIPIPNVDFAAINRNAGDRVETLLKIANWLAAPFGTAEYLFAKFGIEGTHYRLDGTDPVTIPDHGDEINLGTLYLADAARVIYARGRREVAQAAQDYQRQATRKAVKDPTLGLYSPTFSRRSDGLRNELAALEIDIVYGRKPVSAWSDGVARFMKGGGDEMVAEFTEAWQQAAAR